jgi:cytochrome d ubiquinol oxidase subunit I
VLGDESGYTAGFSQKMKIAAIEAMWETEPTPASFTLFGLPDLASETTKYEITIPWVLGLIATRSLDTPVEGIRPLVANAEKRIREGLPAYLWLQKEGGGPTAEVPQELQASMQSLGYAFLLKRIRPDIENASEDQIHEAALSTIPDVPVLFWSFRIMVALGFYFIVLFGAYFYLLSKRTEIQPWFRRLAMYSLPLPWIAAELGWVVAEYGRQPWIIDGVLPTFLGVSDVPASNVLLSLLGFVLFYSVLALIDLVLIVKYVRIGPQTDNDRKSTPPVQASAH